MNFQEVTDKVKAFAEAATPLESTVKFVLDEQPIFIDGNNSNAVSNENTEADCTIAMDLNDFNQMISGELNPTSAFMEGKMKIEGDMAIAMKLTTFFS